MSENETTLPDEAQLDEESTSRRHLLGKGAIAAAAATVAGIAMSKSAEAVDGEDIRIGLSRTAQSSTSLPATVAIPGQVLLIDDQSGFVATDSAHPGALAGWSGEPAAVAAAKEPPARKATEILLVHRPGSVQSNILAGNLISSRLQTSTGPIHEIFSE